MIVLKGLDAAVNHVAFAPDASAVLASGVSGQTVTAVWPLPGGEPVERFVGLKGAAFGPDAGSVIGMKHSPNNWRNFRACRIDRRTRAEANGEVTAGPYTVGMLRVSPQAGLMVLPYLMELKWLTYPDLRPWPGWGAGAQAWDVAFSPDGASVALLSGAVALRETATGALRWEAEVKAKHAGVLGWSADGRLVAASSGPWLGVFDAANGRLVAEVSQERKFFQEAKFTPDGRYLATVSNEATVKFFDTGSWQLRHELAWKVGGLRALDISKDGMLAAAGGAGKKVVVWDLDL